MVHPHSVIRDNPPAGHRGTETASARVAGQVKWFDFIKGYGFITSAEKTDDILLHQVCVRQSGFRTVQEGATVVCETIMGTRGWQATRLISVDNSTARTMPATQEQAPRYRRRTQRALFRRRGQMVQPIQGLWLHLPRRRHAGRIRAYGNPQALRNRRIARRAKGQGADRSGPQGRNGRASRAAGRLSRSVRRTLNRRSNSAGHELCRLSRAPVDAGPSLAAIRNTFIRTLI